MSPKGRILIIVYATVLIAIGVGVGNRSWAVNHDDSQTSAALETMSSQSNGPDALREPKKGEELSEQEKSNLYEELTRLKRVNEDLNNSKWWYLLTGFGGGLVVGGLFFKLGTRSTRTQTQANTSEISECPKCHWKLPKGTKRCPNPDCMTWL